MSKPVQILISQGEQQEQPLSHRDFEVTQEFQDNPDNTFYIAQDSTGKVHGTVMINDKDRRATGALVGNWIASGLVVNRMPYKGLSKIMRALEAAAKEAVAPVVAAAASDGEAPAPATPGASE